jgi:shikimate kinase
VNIVLTGMMGTGKTAVGKKLAEIEGMEYIDTDEMIEKDIGISINEIFKRNGEKEFREMEKKAVKCVSILNNFVISTGGGVVKDAGNMDELEKNSIIVCLTADSETIYKRTNKHTNRPLLKVEDPKLEIEKLINERKRFYKRCDLMVDTSNKEIDIIVDEIVKFVESRRNV